jgi:hypothetical protein
MRILTCALAIVGLALAGSSGMADSKSTPSSPVIGKPAPDFTLKDLSWSLSHPILRDESGSVGKSYGATNTPNMFVIDKTGAVVYAGAIDNSPDGEGKSAQGGKLVNYVDAALDDIAAGRPVKTAVTKPYGCSVKYGS